MASSAEPTNRMMHPSFEEPSHIGKAEYAGEPVETAGCKVTACYYLTRMTKRISSHPGKIMQNLK